MTAPENRFSTAQIARVLGDVLARWDSERCLSGQDYASGQLRQEAGELLKALGGTNRKSPAVQYRVTWKRQDAKRKTKIFANLSTAQGLRALLTAESVDAVLKLKGLNPEEPECCYGVDCGCQGATNREIEAAYQFDLPALVYCLIEERAMGPWTPIEVEGGPL